jgi:hypothetical protein
MLTLPMATAPEKPDLGKPCNGCGFCCAAEVCELGRRLLETKEAPCPALEFDGGRFWCELVRNPAYHLDMKPGEAAECVSRVMTLMLGIGKGCDSGDGDFFAVTEDIERVMSGDLA